MKTKTPHYMRPVDVHAALAHAHTARAEYLGQALAKLPALVRRVATKLRHPHLRHSGISAC
jgi:hypothetical protein